MVRRGVSDALVDAADLRLVAAVAEWPAIGAATLSTPDAVVVAPSPGETDLPAILTSVRAAYPSTKVILVTADPSVVDFDALFRAEAAGLLLLDEIGGRTLVDAVRAILDHGLAVTSQSALRAFLAAQPRRPLSRAPRPDVSAEEALVLRRLGEGLTIEEVARAEHLSVRTVNRIVERLLDRFGATTRFELAMKATLFGIIP